MRDSENEVQKEPKIIVDTDWKEQVAREKELVGTTSDADVQAPAGPDTLPASASPACAGDALEPEFPPPPPATFDALISMLFTHAMAFLGQMPDPESGETRINKPYAKHYIDTIEMLSEKTSGNLSKDESKVLSEVLHALRMMYVNAKA